MIEERESTMNERQKEITDREKERSSKEDAIFAQFCAQVGINDIRCVRAATR